MSRNFLLIAALTLLSSCAHKSIPDPTKQALMVSGCASPSSPSRFSGKPTTGRCSTNWINKNTGEIVAIDDFTSAVFVEPGRYSLSSYIGVWEKYVRYEGAIELLTEVLLKPGDVVYIGHIDINEPNKQGNALNALSVREDVKAARAYLSEEFPSQAPKLKVDMVGFSKEALVVKKLLSIR